MNARGDHAAGVFQHGILSLSPITSCRLPAGVGFPLGGGWGYDADVKAATSTTDAEAILRENALRRTPVRVGVLDQLTRARQPLSVPQLLSKMKSVDSVTVYRTLNTFTRKGIVHRVRGEDRSWLYALSDESRAPEHKHPHFVCEVCGRVECLADSEIPHDFVPSLGVASGYAVNHAEVILHGICPTCR